MTAAAWMFEGAGFLLGLLLGSFLNVCISRLPEHRSISKPRSHCPNCLHTIRWYDNIPLLSWVLLAAKCRHCGQPIPWRYPAVELSVAILAFICMGSITYMHRFRSEFLAAPPIPANATPHFRALVQKSMEQSAELFNHGIPLVWITVIGIFVCGFLLIGLMVMDWRSFVLPDAFTLTGIGIGFLLVCTQAIFLPTGAEDIHLNPQHGLRMDSPGSFASRGDVFLTGPEHLVFGRLLAIVLAAAIPLTIRTIYKAVRGREGMGIGDAKLLAMIAAFLGFWPAMFALFAGVVLCSGYGAVLLARRRADLASRLPLGSFLALGGMLAIFYGDDLIAWYRGLL